MNELVRFSYDIVVCEDFKLHRKSFATINGDLLLNYLLCYVMLCYMCFPK